MYEQRVEWVEQNALAVDGRERDGFSVGREHAAPEAAEESHHGKVDFTVTAVNSGIDQTRSALLVDVQIAAPQIAVQARGRLAFANQLRQARK